MIQLRLLILFLLVSSKSFSQTDTIKKIVLNENVAREVVKDLIKGDICQQQLLFKQEEIQNLQEQNNELIEIIKIKDNLLFKKNEIILIQDKSIGWFKKPQLHGYLGTRTINSSLINPYFYGTLLLEFHKFSIGGQYFLQPNNPSGYGFILEYNLF
jgi:hypothetical protein